jgi:hypothetical protein
MKVIALMTDINREIPGAPMRDFFRLVNDEVKRLLSLHDWTYYRGRTTFDLPEIFTNVTLTNGSAAVTLTGAYLQASVLNGKGLTASVGGTDYDLTISTVNSATTLTLSAAWAYTTTSAATITLSRRSDWRLPTDFRTLRYVSYESDGKRLHDPYDYTFDKRTSDNRELLVWHRQPTSTDSIVVDYYRHDTEVNDPNDTIDIDSGHERLFYLMVTGRLLRRMATRGIEDPFALRIQENSRMYEEALAQAKYQDTMRRRPTWVNQRTLLRTNRYV